MDSQKEESIEYQCEKLGGIAHVKVKYYYGKERRFLGGFYCDRASDCGIRRSPISGSFNYTVDCLYYIAFLSL